VLPQNNQGSRTSYVGRTMKQNSKATSPLPFRKLHLWRSCITSV